MVQEGKSPTESNTADGNLRLISDDQLEFNPLYVNQKSTKFLLKALADKSKVISCSDTKLSCSSLDSLKSGLVEQDNGIPAQITSLDVNQTHLITTDSNECKIFKTKPLKMLRTVARKVGLRIARVSPSGLIAMGSDEPDIAIGCVIRADHHKVLSGHRNAVIGLAFHPSSTALVSVGSDGLVKVWSAIGDDWKELYSTTALISPQVAEEANLDLVMWNPSGSAFALGSQSEIYIIKYNSWEIIKTLKLDCKVKKVEYSSSGYLAAIDTNGIIYIYDHDYSLLLKRGLDNPICDAIWHPTENGMFIADQLGNVIYWDKVVQNFKKSKPEKEDIVMNESLLDDLDDDIFGDLEAVEEEIEPTNAQRIKDNGDTETVDEFGMEEDLNDFIVDDDGAGYIEELRDEAGYKKYQERSKEQALSKLKMDFDTTEPLFKLGNKTKSSEGDIQPAFQSCSIPIKGNRHYLCFNMIGTICAIHSSDQYQMDVSFHDSTSRPFHFTCLENYSIATLGSSGAVFACPSTTTTFSKAYYRPVDNWSNKNDWSLEMPLNENILAVGVSKFAVILATDANYARILTLSGIQTAIRSLPGPIVTVAGNDIYVMLVYHLSGLYNDSQNLGYSLHNTQTGEVIEGACPITPLSTLTWAGFSQMGFPLTYDSKGVLRGLFLNDNIWSPIFDSALYKGDKTETYWPVGCTDVEFQAVICRGTTVPTHPKPIINDLPLQIPFCGINSEKVMIEEKSSRGRLMLTQMRQSDQIMEITRREKELDKFALQMIMFACKSEQIQRVLDLANQVFSIKTLDGAIKVASYNKMITLAERLTQMKEHRLRKEEELNRGYEDEIPYIPPVFEERRYEPKPAPIEVPNYAQDDIQGRYNGTDNQEPFEFEATQTHTRPKSAQPEDQVIAKPSTKKKANPFSVKPKDPSFLISSTKSPLDGLKAVAKAIAPSSAPAIAPQKRKQMGIMAFASVNAEKKVKASVADEEVPIEKLDAPREKKASSSSFIPKVTLKDHFNSVAEEAADKEPVFVPNKSIVPENETEEERIKRIEVEKMFEEDDNKENPVADLKGKGKAPANPKSLLKNQGWTVDEDQQVIN